MTSWSRGYVSDVEYLPGYYADQAPGHLQLACLIKGYEPPLTNPSFTYCELGCGQGTTANVIAAANPLAKVIAIDFNPAHIARAKRNALEYGLTNIEFLELSFEELAQIDTLKNFDIVSLHGVWSWISQKDREAIVEFLKVGVRPGGLVSLSYNAMPGWTSILPFQRMLFEHSRLHSDRSDKRVLASLDFIEKMQQLGCTAVGDKKSFSFFRSSNTVRSQEDQAVYLAHEYLNENWQPLYHADTVRMLEPAKLNFVSSATLLDNFSDLMLTPEQREVADLLPPGVMRETLKDYFVNRPFRRDIFIRGAQSISDSRRDDLLGKMGLASLVSPEAAKLIINTPAGQATLPQAQYEPIFEALASRPHLIKEIYELLKQKNIEKTPSMVEIAGILVGTGQVLLLPWGTELKSSFATQFYNCKVIEPVIAHESGLVALASPLACSGLYFNAVETTIFHLVTSGLKGEELISNSLKLLKPDKNEIVIDGETITDPMEIEEKLKEGIQWTIDNRIPIWKQLFMI
jgi:SAM-dependent methyltransferase